MSRAARSNRAVIDDLHYTINKYPSPENNITVGGDSVYTVYPQAREFLEVLRLARIGLAVQGEASKNIPDSWRSI